MTRTEAIERARTLVLAGPEVAQVPPVVVEVVEALVDRLDAYEREHAEIRRRVSILDSVLGDLLEQSRR